MPKYFQKLLLFVPLFTIAPLLATLLFWPALSSQIGVVTLLLSIVIAIGFSVQNHWQIYLQAECTREKMARNLALDITGLLLTMAAAIYAGGQAGHWAGVRSNLWAGLAAGFLVGFLAARVVRSLWGRVVKFV